VSLDCVFRCMTSSMTKTFLELASGPCMIATKFDNSSVLRSTRLMARNVLQSQSFQTLKFEKKNLSPSIHLSHTRIDIHIYVILWSICWSSIVSSQKLYITMVLTITNAYFFGTARSLKMC
jgi:hypothetical protein